MQEPSQNPPATVPQQPEAKPPVRKGMPLVIALVVIIALIGIANLSSLVSGNKKAVPASALPMRPASANPQQVSSFESQQAMQAQRDAEARQRQQELATAMQQLQAAQETPGPEATGAPPISAPRSMATVRTHRRRPPTSRRPRQRRNKKRWLARSSNRTPLTAIRLRSTSHTLAGRPPPQPFPPRPLRRSWVNARKEQQKSHLRRSEARHWVELTVLRGPPPFEPHRTKIRKLIPSTIPWPVMTSTLTKVASTGSLRAQS
jgi:hypothetical protein